MTQHCIVKLGGRIVRSNLYDIPFPYRLTFAVTDCCQARCVMCGIWKKSVQDELTLAEIDTLFSKANRFSWINLTGGELFQRPDIYQIILSIAKHSRDLYLLNFPTNGYQSDDIVTTVDAILKSTSVPRVVVSVSMDGPQALHDRIRGLTGSWQHAIQTFGQLKERRSRRFSVYLGYTLQAANQGLFNDTLLACRDALGSLTVDDFHVNLAHASNHYYDNSDTDALPDPEQAVAEIESVSRERTYGLLDPVAFVERRYQRHISQYLMSGRAPFTCQAAAASCFINSSGIVFPCSVFDTPIGSLRESEMDLYSLWRSSARFLTRNSIRNNGCPGCWTPCEAYQTILANLLRFKGHR